MKGNNIMRVVKDALERRTEILDAAEKLFGQKGFDGTSTNDILGSVGIARGTLYYHFKSKEDIMDALILRYHDRIVTTATMLAQDKSIPVYERLIRVIMAMNLSGESESEVIGHIHKPQNALMHQKTQKLIVNGITPIITPIIVEGIKEGIFETPYPYECMEMLIIYANSVFDDDMITESNGDKASRMKAFVFNAERLLGAERGRFEFVMNQTIIDR